MRRALYLVACLSSLPAGADSSGPPRPRYLLLPTNATVYQAPSLGAPSVHLDGAAEDLARRVVVRWIADAKDEFVEVESLQPSELSDHCYELPLDPQIRWRLFVPRAALSPVLTRPVSILRGDGTRVTLGAGLTVGEKPSGAERRAVELLGLRLLLAIPDDAIGVTYQPPSTPFDDHVTRREVEPKAPLTFDGARVRKDEGALLVYDERRVSGGVLVTLRHRCGEVRAITARSAVRAAPSERNSDTDTRPIDPPAIRVIAGARLYWADSNGVAGTVRDDIHLVGPVDIKNGRLCFERRLLPCVTNPAAGPPARDLVRLCVEERNVVLRPTSP